MAKLEGPDVSIETSLKEYGIAWKIGETETRFFYGVKHNGSEYVCFDWADLGNNVNLSKEYDWVDLNNIAKFTGMSLREWEKKPLVQKIYDLVAYYEVEDIFGSTYGEPMTYEEVIAKEGK